MADRRRRHRGGMALAVIVGIAVASGLAGADERVAITATDGVQLVGHLAGREGPGIVFAHTFRGDQRIWTAFAQSMASAGFRTLTFDFRGYGESVGEKDVGAIDRDLEGAYRYMIGRKIRPVYLVGASMGGAAALIVAGRVPIAGVATLSAPITFRDLDAASILPKMTMRKLFIAAEGDAAAAAAARRLATDAPDPKTIQIVPGTEHGIELLTGSQAAVVDKALRAFLTNPTPAGT